MRRSSTVVLASAMILLLTGCVGRSGSEPVPTSDAVRAEEDARQEPANPWEGTFVIELTGDPTIVASTGAEAPFATVTEIDGSGDHQAEIGIGWGPGAANSHLLYRELTLDTGYGSTEEELGQAVGSVLGGSFVGSVDGRALWVRERTRWDDEDSVDEYGACPVGSVPTEQEPTDVVTGPGGRVESFSLTALLFSNLGFQINGQEGCEQAVLVSVPLAFTRGD